MNKLQLLMAAIEEATAPDPALKANKTYAVYMHDPRNNEYAYLEGFFDAKKGDTLSDLKKRVSRSNPNNLFVFEKAVYRDDKKIAAVGEPGYVEESGSPYQKGVESVISDKKLESDKPLVKALRDYADLCDGGADEEEAFDQAFKKFSNSTKSNIKHDLIKAGVMSDE